MGDVLFIEYLPNFSDSLDLVSHCFLFKGVQSGDIHTGNK